METIENYINSGILELYILGMTSDEETREVTELAAKHVEIKTELDAIEKALNGYADEVAPEISLAVKANIMATIDYTERLQNGEPMSNPPMLNKDSKLDEFSQWLTRDDMQTPDDLGEIHAKIIAATPEAKTLIVWLKTGAPSEVHTNEFEHFLIAEGTCDITIGETKHSLKAGDYLSIPLYIAHDVKVTSEMACKIILQRLVA